MRTFALSIAWVDTHPDTEMVEVHYTWTPPGGAPAWDGTEEVAVLPPVPDSSPRTRAAAVELPRGLGGGGPYDWHWFYLIIDEGGHQRRTYPLVERVAPHRVTYEDREGALTSVAVHWGVYNWTAPNYDLLALEGLPFPAEAPGPGAGPPAVFEFVRVLPLPRRFHGRVWGPDGATVHLAYHLHRHGSPDPGDDFQRWDNNAGANYQVIIPGRAEAGAAGA